MRVAVLSPVVPYPPRSGGRLGVASDVQALQANGCTVYLIAWHVGDNRPAARHWPVEGTVLKTRPGGRLRRWLRSLPTSLPAACERYYGRAAGWELRRIVRRVRPQLIVLADTVLAHWIPLLREVAPQSQVVLRPNNYMAEVARQEAESAPGWMRRLWQQQADRWTSLEEDGVKMSDATWAIAPHDTEMFRRAFPQAAVEYLPVSIDLSRYGRISRIRGKRRTLVHVGSIDLRKRHGWNWFFAACWPELRKRGAGELILAGHATARFRIAQPAVHHLGPVEDDRAVLIQGPVFVNPQRIGNGIKLKSLVAMASGRVLLSTHNGVLGLPLDHGRHYWNLEIMAQRQEWDRLWESEDQARGMAEQGRAWVEQHHAPRVVADTMWRLLNKLHRREAAA